ncbi:RloB family protein, partial [Legionella pneumophila serogroup 1]
MGGADKIFQKRKHRGPNSFKRSKNVREAYDVVLIICEGEKTEPHYIKELLSELKLSSANIKVVGLGTDPLTLVEYAVEEYNRTRDYDRIYCIFDKDKHTTYEQAKEKITLLQKRVKKSIPIYAITSVPCFEYWILLHYVDTASPYNGVGSKSAAFYPEHCIPIMKWLSIPFKIDEESKQLGHDEEQRLAYHQK